MGVAPVWCKKICGHLAVATDFLSALSRRHWTESREEWCYGSGEADVNLEQPFSKAERKQKVSCNIPCLPTCSLHRSIEQFISTKRPLFTCRATSSGTKLAPKPSLQKQEQETKRRKANDPPGNTIELDLGSSDDEEINIVLRRWLA
jgi:hypothetical protein